MERFSRRTGKWEGYIYVIRNVILFYHIDTKPIECSFSHQFHEKKYQSILINEKENRVYDKFHFRNTKKIRCQFHLEILCQSKEEKPSLAGQMRLFLTQHWWKRSSEKA